MNHLFKAAAFVACLAAVGSAQTITNVQFKDMKGKAYDLYTLLGQGKHVYVEMFFNG